MLSRNEKTIAHILFKLLVYRSDGIEFERLFTSIMNYAEPEFKQIKPWGNIGDRKNDGYIKSKGVFFQVYAPEDLINNSPAAVKKLKNDFLGLMRQWSPINEFYFVMNDKYKGVPPDVEIMLSQIISDNKLNGGGALIAKDLENKLFTLPDDQIQNIVGCIPNPSNFQLDFNILNDVIKHIMQLSIAQSIPSDIILPNWNQKILFNNLSEATAIYLNGGSLQINNLQKYLDNNSSFLSDTLRDKINEIYISKKACFSGDELFWAIVKEATPSSELQYQSAVIVIMAKYFEACDIFERPEESKNDYAN